QPEADRGRHAARLRRGPEPVPRRQHRPALRDAAPARTERDAVSAAARPGRPARPAGQRPSGPWWELRAEAGATGAKGAVAAGAPGCSTYIVCEGKAIPVPAAFTIS